MFWVSRAGDEPRLVYAPSGRPLYVEVTSPAPELEHGLRFAVLGTEVDRDPGRVHDRPGPSSSSHELRRAAFYVVIASVLVWLCSDRFYPEERPVREVSVDGFWIHRHPVTVGEFRRFVKATDHVTWAEQAPVADDYPATPPPSPCARVARVP